MLELELLLSSKFLLLQLLRLEQELELLLLVTYHLLLHSQNLLSKVDWFARVTLE